MVVKHSNEKKKKFGQRSRFFPHNNKHLNSKNFCMDGFMVKMWSTRLVVGTNLAFGESKS